MTIQMLPLSKLRTSLAHLRSDVSPRQIFLQQLPIRVVPSEGGFFEVVDGFKRLRAACDSGAREIAVVVEQATGPQVKALVIRANAMPNTLTPLDEARVIVSLVEEDGLTLACAAKLLRRGRPWASKRHSLVKRLAVPLHKHVDEGRLPICVAYALTGFSRKTQVDLARVMADRGLSAGNALALLSTYRSLTSEGDRRILLKDPLDTLQQMQRAKTSPVLSSMVCRRQERYRSLQELLDEFLHEEPLTLSAGEARLISAERKMLAVKIISCAQELSQVPIGTLNTGGKS